MVTLFTFDLHKNALFAAFCSRLLTGYSQLMASTSLALRVFMKVSKMAAKAGSQTCDARTAANGADPTPAVFARTLK